MAHEVFRRNRDVEDDEWPGRPVKVKTDENVEKVRICENRSSLGIGMIAWELNMDKETVRQI
jgi:hypothetical protein